MDVLTHPDAIHPVVVDTDMALDDVRALLALLAEPRLELLAVVTVEGSASLGRGTDNLVGLLQSLDRTDVAVLRGTAFEGGPAPGWRARVERLAGAGFPSPRGRIEVESSVAGLSNLLERCEGDLRYLALGPLGNLVALQRGHASALQRLASIWIPAEVGANGEVDAWNLRFDPAATGEVFETAPRLVLVDVSVWRRIDARVALSSVEGSGAAARWIRHTLEDEAADVIHWQIYDELVVAAAAGGGQVEYDAHRYVLAAEKGGTCRLRRRDDGNVTVVRFNDIDATLGYLRQRWEASAGQRVAGVSHPRDGQE